MKEEHVVLQRSVTVHIGVSQGSRRKKGARPQETHRKKPNPELNPHEVYRFLVWEPCVTLGKTIETKELQGTLEGSRVFLGMGPHCNCWNVQA